jgi:hypothetical protein
MAKDATGANYIHPDHQTCENIIMSTYVDNVNTHHTSQGELKINRNKYEAQFQHIEKVT